MRWAFLWKCVKTFWCISRYWAIIWINRCVSLVKNVFLAVSWAKCDVKTKVLFRICLPFFRLNNSLKYFLCFARTDSLLIVGRKHHYEICQTSLSFFSWEFQPIFKRIFQDFPVEFFTFQKFNLTPELHSCKVQQKHENKTWQLRNLCKISYFDFLTTNECV